MTLLLLFIATILLLSVLLSKLSAHVGMPVLLAFLFLGMLFGSDGLAHIPFENYDFANQISTVADSAQIGRRPGGSPCPPSCSPPWACS